MACFHPIDAWKVDGRIVFSEPRFKTRKSALEALSRFVALPCGRCIGCRLERSRQWAVRCMHEAQMHEESSFITLTYDEANACRSLNYSDFQKFMKRLRFHYRPRTIRFYMCGEYGEQFSRPHFHACLFGVGFADRKLWQKLPSGSSLYRSSILESLWPFGFSSVGDVTFESAAYVARYVMKKVIGRQAASSGGVGGETPALGAYERLCVYTGEVYEIEPEFNSMSLKPGIGAGWMAKYAESVYPHDFVIVNGHKVKPPRYYDKVFKDMDVHVANRFGFDYDALEFERFKAADKRSANATPERLAVREIVAKARLKSKLRVL